MATNAHPSLQSLPAEAIVGILDSIDEPQSLAAFLQASPTAFRLFASDGGKVLDGLFSRTLAPPVEQLIRSVAALRSCPSAIFQAPEESSTSIHSFLHRYIGQMPDEATDRFASLPLAQSCQENSGVPYGIVTTLHKVTLLAQAAAAYFRKTLVEANPQHLVNTKDNYAAHTNPWRCRWQGHSYEVRFGPLRWIEHLRLSRALWRLQLLDDLQRAAALNRMPQLPQEMITQLQSADLHDVVNDTDDATGQMDELMSMIEFLGHGQDSPVQRPLALPLTPIQIGPLPGTARFGLSGRLWHAEPRDDTRPLVEHAWMKRSFGTSTLDRASRYPFSPIRDVSQHHYFRFGIPFWDRPTLERLQLLGSKQWQGLIYGDFVFTWRSLLTEAQISDLENHLEQNP